MRKGFCVLMFAGLALGASRNPSAGEIDDIIAKFAAKEAEFAQARGSYTYRQTAKLQEMDDGGGRWEMISDIIFTPEGKRTERVVRAPVANLRFIIMSPEDEQDLRNVLPFVLTTKDISNYDVRYMGRQTLDEISCYVFAVKPKHLEHGQRYFEGQVWVDDRDLQIVKSYGRGTGYQKKSSDQQFPKFETYREQIDGKYWFPTYTIANDTLHFKDQSVRVKQTVRYEDYKQFKSDVIIKYGDAVDDKKPDQNPQLPGKAPPKKP